MTSSRSFRLIVVLCLAILLATACTPATPTPAAAALVATTAMVPPTGTATPTAMSTDSATPTDRPTATATATEAPTDTPTTSPASTPTATLKPKPTNTAAASSVATNVPPASGTPQGKNLIVNGDAESGAGAQDDSTTVPVPDWTSTGEFTAVQYGASGGFADSSSPGPQDRGKNYFVGGPGGDQSSAQQTINVTPLADAIDTGNVKYQFEGWLGGFEGQDDNATVTGKFLDGSGRSLGEATLGPVNAPDRNNETGMILKSTNGNLPKGTRTITVAMLFTRITGIYIDGSVDNLSLVLGTQ